jgi:hypothetical protein
MTDRRREKAVNAAADTCRARRSTGSPQPAARAARRCAGPAGRRCAHACAGRSGLYALYTAPSPRARRCDVVVLWDDVTDKGAARSSATRSASTSSRLAGSHHRSVGSVLLACLVTDDYLRREGLDGPEVYACTCSAAHRRARDGDAANDLVVLFLGLEVLSIALYVMAASHRRASESQESGIKYFVLGGSPRRSSSTASRWSTAAPAARGRRDRRRLQRHLPSSARTRSCSPASGCCSSVSRSRCRRCRSTSGRPTCTRVRPRRSRRSWRRPARRRVRRDAARAREALPHWRDD